MEVVQELQRERDHLLLLHEALGEVDRATTLDERLRLFVESIRRIGFGRVTITLRDSELNATTIVAAGLSEDELRHLRERAAPGSLWRSRLAEMDRFRISNSWYLPGRDPWVVREFGDAIRSTLSPALDPDWSPHDLLLVPLRTAQG
nr:hypothetical protein [Gemmatimonadaceae bacterium]